MSETHPFLQNTSTYLLQFFVKSLSALFVGTTAALIFHSFFNYGVFGFVFVGVVFAGLVLKVLRKSSLLKVFLFDAAFIFLLLLLKTYITLAPNL